MTAIDLYKYVNDNGIEWHYYDGMVYLMVDNLWIKEFHNLLDATIFDDDGINCVMKDGYFVFEMNDICGYYGIDISEVFGKEIN